MKRFFSILALLVLLTLTVVIRCWNYGDVVVGEQTHFFRVKPAFFVDPDCYSRMTRVAMVEENGKPVHRHFFENCA